VNSVEEINRSAQFEPGARAYRRIVGECVPGSARPRTEEAPEDSVYLEFEYEQPSTDSLARALDYRDVRDKVLAAVEKRRFCLIETMARAILDAVTSDPRVSRVCVRVEKTRALKQARAVTAVVEWNRTNGNRLL